MTDNMELLRKLMGEDLWNEGFVCEMYGHWKCKHNSTEVDLSPKFGTVKIWDVSMLPETDMRLNLSDPDLKERVRIEMVWRVNGREG